MDLTSTWFWYLQSLGRSTPTLFLTSRMVRIRKFLDLFLSRVTKETDGLSLRALHTDNFSSFKSNVAHLASRGCHWEFVTPGSSHQNPAERYIQTVNNTLRAVMLASGLPRFLWPIVLSACVFCCNLYPRKDELHSKEEVFSGCVPDVSPLSAHV